MVVVTEVSMAFLLEKRSVLFQHSSCGQLLTEAVSHQLLRWSDYTRCYMRDQREARSSTLARNAPLDITTSSRRDKRGEKRSRARGGLQRGEQQRYVNHRNSGRCRRNGSSKFRTARSRRCTCEAEAAGVREREGDTLAIRRS